MSLAHAFALLTIVATLGLLYAERIESRRLVWATKPFAALGFVLAAASLHALETPHGRAILVGAILGAIGDVLLIRKEDKRWFLWGILAFLAGHLGYVVGFALRGVDPAACAITLAVLAAPGVLVGRYLWPRAGKLAPAVVAYISVITAMMGAAIGAVAAGTTWLLAVGATMFYLSDLCVARERFVEHGFINKLIGQPLYFGGQLVIVFSAL